MTTTAESFTVTPRLVPHPGNCGCGECEIERSGGDTARSLFFEVLDFLECSGYYGELPADLYTRACVLRSRLKRS
jgi:hypothetical protein